MSAQGLDAGEPWYQIASMDMRAPVKPAADRDFLSAATMLLPFVAALAMVALSTLAGTAIAPRWGNGAVDLLYLPAILATAILFGLWPALAAGLASAVAYNFFFTTPFHTLRMDRPADIVTAVILFLVATVTSKLAASVRDQAAISAAHANRNATVAGFAARLLACADKSQIASTACEEIARIFGCNAIMVEGLPTPVVLASAPSLLHIGPAEIATAAAVLELGESAGRGAMNPYPTDWQFHPVRSNGDVLVSVGLVRDDDSLAVREDQQQLVASLLDQVALGLERARVEREARDVASLQDRDRVRSLLISSIGRDLMPRIEAISAAARKLRREVPDGRLIASTIMAETLKADRYVTNLRDLETDSDQRPIEVKGVTIDIVQRRVEKDGKPVHLTPKEYAVLVELAKHPGRVLSHAHLLRTAWGPAQESQTEYLRVAIRALRQKLERDPAHPDMIRNEPAVGYLLAT